MTTTTFELVSYEDPGELTERVAIGGFLAGYTGNTRSGYTTDLRIFANWCHHNQLTLFGVRRVHLELFARWMESEGRMRSTVGRRLSTLASFYHYCVVARDPSANVRRPKVDHESRTPSGWIATSSAPCSSKPASGRRVISVGHVAGDERSAHLRGVERRRRRP